MLMHEVVISVPIDAIVKDTTSVSTIAVALSSRGRRLMLLLVLVIITASSTHRSVGIASNQEIAIKLGSFHAVFSIGHDVVVIFPNSRILGDLQMIFFGDQHGLQGIQGTLLFFVRNKHSAFFTIKCPINAGHGT